MSGINLHKCPKCGECYGEMRDYFSETTYYVPCRCQKKSLIISAVISFLAVLGMCILLLGWPS